jgi:sigma-B regulation protein RsbU (phosphoserine phosphatase)
VNAVPLASAGDGERRALRFLAELSQALAESLDLRETLHMAVTRIADFMQAEAASLFLLDHAGLIECRICVGPVDITGLKLAVGQGVVGRCVADNATQIVRDARNDARVNVRVDAETGFATRSILCAPLSNARGPIGALEVINRRDGSLFDEEDAEILRLVAAPAVLAIGNAQLAQGLVEQQRIKRELELARRMQKSMLPRRRRGDFPIRGVNLPAHEISGDFYDFFDLPDGRLAFVIGDVSGKGLDAAFLMVRVASMLRWVGAHAPAPGAWLAQVNEELCRSVQDGRFVCAAVGQYDRASGKVCLASAGFPPALLHDGSDFEELPADGPPLGIIAEAEYGEREFALGPHRRDRSPGRSRPARPDRAACGAGAGAASARGHRRSEAPASGRRHHAAAPAGALRHAGAHLAGPGISRAGGADAHGARGAAPRAGCAGRRAGIARPARSRRGRGLHERHPPCLRRRMHAPHRAARRP